MLNIYVTIIWNNFTFQNIYVDWCTFHVQRISQFFQLSEKNIRILLLYLRSQATTGGWVVIKKTTGVNEAPHLQYGNHHQVLPLSYQLFLGFSFSLSVSPWTKWQVVELSPHALRGRPPGCWEGVEDSNLLPGAVDGRFSMGLDASSTSDLGESLKKPQKQTINK